MSITVPPKGTHFSDGVRVGPILGSQYIAGANVLAPATQVASPIDSLAPGVYITPTSLLDIIPFAVSTANIAAAQTAAAAGYLTLLSTSNAGITWMASFAGTSGPSGAGVIALDVPRNVTVTGFANTVQVNVYIFGWDQYEQPMVEQIVGPTGATSSVGVKAWKYIQSVYVDGGTTANISVGVGNVFGLPYFLGDANYVFSQNFNGALDAGTIVVGDPETATGTTGDVRGTYTPAANANTVKRLTLNMYNASGDTRNYNAATVGTVYLANNALAITNTTRTITVTAPGHNFTNGENVTIAGSAAIGNITTGQINITAPVTITNSSTFTYTFTGTAATSSASGGGAAIQMTPAKGNLYQNPAGRFGVAQFVRALF